MNHLTQIMGLGTPGELRNGPDGRVYGWVEGLDSYGRRRGGWTPYNRLRRRVYRLCAYTFPKHFGRHPVIRPAGPTTQIRPIYSKIVRSTTSLPRIQRPRAVSLRGLGAPAEIQGLLGVGYPGVTIQGPDGQLYGWISGYDGLGTPLGFWGKLKRLAKKLAKKVLPMASNLLPFVPGVGPAAATALKVARGAGLLGIAQTGTPIYRGIDGSLYGVQGIGNNIVHGLEADPIHGLEADPIHGLEADPIHGLEADPIHGLEADPIHGLEADPIHGLEADPIHGLEADPIHGLEADPIHGLEADPIHGLEADPIHGLEADSIHGLEADPIHGLEADPIHGLEADSIHGLEIDLIHGLESDPIHDLNGYISNKNGLLGYEQARPSTTPMFRTPTNTPDFWKPHW